MKKKPKITILLATYNRAHLIGETLDSFSAQTYKEWECIIVDDFSTDNTFEVVKSYINKDNRIHYYLKTEKYKRGLSGTRNYGLDLAKERRAKYIQFFDDDDLMHPKKLELQIVPFFKNSNLNFTVCKFDKLIESNNSLKIEKPKMHLDFPHLGDAILTGEMKMNSLGPLWRSSFIQNFRFDERMQYAEEWELYTRIGYRYPQNYEVVDAHLFQYRKHNNTLTMGDDPDYERRKTSEIVRIKLLEDLTKNRLHTKTSILFFAKTFLLYSYKPILVRELRAYVEQNQGFSKKMIWFLNNGLFIAKYYRKILQKLSLWV